MITGFDTLRRHPPRPPLHQASWLVGAILFLFLAQLSCQSPASPRPGYNQQGSPLPMQPSPVSTGFPDFASVVSQTSASVVSVVNVRPQPPSQLIDATEPSTEASAQQAPQSHARWVGIGSGFAVGTHEILTSAHVLEGAQSLEIVLGDDSRYRATVIATEPRVDLALLSMQGDAQHPAPPLTPLVFSAETPAIGSWALSVGHPHGLGYTVTPGIITGKGRDYDDLGRPVVHRNGANL